MILWCLVELAACFFVGTGISGCILAIPSLLLVAAQRNDGEVFCGVLELEPRVLGEGGASSWSFVVLPRHRVECFSLPPLSLQLMKSKIWGQPGDRHLLVDNNVHSHIPGSFTPEPIF